MLNSSHYWLNKISEQKEVIVKIIVLLLISWLYLGRSFHSFKTPVVLGDGFEYILTTEALVNHASPNITLEDHLSFKSKYEKAHKWSDFYQKDFFDKQIEKIKNSKGEFKESVNGIYCTKTKKWFSFHFSFYSLINVPMYVIGAHYGPIRPFYFTNALLIILTCFAFLFYTPFKWYNSIIASLIFAFSAAYWYLSWQHTEVLTMCLVSLSLINYFNEKYYIALLFTALACLQNQPLLLLFGFLAFDYLLKSGFKRPIFIKIGFLSLIALSPPIFYYINFDTTNLIKDAGYLSTNYITVNRVAGFYFDLNQGMILTIPLILITYILLCLNNVFIVMKDKSRFEFSMLLVLVLLGISISVSTMGNWNHGMAIINRYASWLSVIVIVHTFYLINSFNELFKTVFLNYFFASQVFTTLYHEQFNEYGWSSLKMMPLSKWCLNNYPNLYNPDPYIFAGRVTPNIPLMDVNSPYVYFKGNEIKKIMVHKNKLDDLLNFGMDKNAIIYIERNAKFNFGWGYIPMDQIKQIKDPMVVKSFIREKKIQAAYGKILNSSDWTAQIKQKAKDWGKTFDEVLRLDAEYIVNLDEQAEQQE